MSRRSGHIVADIIEDEGVSHVFTVPGESVLPVLDGIGESSVELISTRHEGGASFMAEAMAKATGRTTVCMASRIPGGANLSLGLHTARQDSSPVVALVGQVPTEYRGREAWQEVDLVDFYKPMVKWAAEVSDPRRLPELLRRAFAISREGRPGPVVLALPEDVLSAPVEGLKAGVRLDRHAARPVPDRVTLQLLAHKLRAARRPFIIAGGGCRLGEARGHLVAIAEALEAPVAVAFRRHDAFPNDHRLFAGHLGIKADATLVEAIRESDLVMAVGTRLGELTSQHYSVPGPTAGLIHIDADEHAVYSGVTQPEIAVVANPAETLAALHGEFLEAGRGSATTGSAVGSDGRTGEPGKVERATRLHRRYLDYSNPQELRSDTGVHPEGIMRELATLLPDDAIITNDAGTFASWLHRFRRFPKQLTYLGPTSGSMGYGFPAALGARLAFPDRLCVSFSGDGGFLMTAAELETAVRYRIPVIALVFNDRRYDAIRLHQEQMFPGRAPGTELGDVDFARLASSYGAFGVRVGSNGDFRAAFEEAVASGLPAVIELQLDRQAVASSVSEVAQMEAR